MSEELLRMIHEELVNVHKAIDRLAESMQKVPALKPADQCEKLPDGRYRWRVTEQHESATCRNCGRSIFWMKSRRGKNVPVDPDGFAHFDTCPGTMTVDSGSDGGDDEVPF